MKSLLVVLSLIVFSLSSCDKNKVYQKYVSLPDYAWLKTNSIDFKVNIEDTAIAYNVFLNVRHTDFYPYKNLWVKLKSQVNDKLHWDEEIELILQEKSGKWMSDCSGNICDAKILIKAGEQFSSAGEYTFTLTQIMRVDPVVAIMDMGLRIEKAN